MRNQFPMVEAEAITIHKSQGSTFERVAIQIPNRNERSMIYVALSRATRLDQLFMVGKKLLPPKPPDENDKVVQEMSRLRKEALLIPKFCYLRDIPNGCVQIISQNVRSLEKHINSLRNDPVFTSSQFILLQETWHKQSISGESISIQGKKLASRNMLPDQFARGKGTIIYHCENCPVSSHAYVDRGPSCPIDVTICTHKDIVLINMYRSDDATEFQLKMMLFKIKNYITSSNVLLCGDFNVNLAESSNPDTKKLLRQLSEHNLNLLSPIQPTTDFNTTIDGVFGRLNNYDCEINIYESYASDHKPLIIRLKQKQNHSSGLSQPLRTFNL